MADEPIGFFDVNLDGDTGEQPQDAVKSPDVAAQMSRMAESLNSIGKNVASILQVTRVIADRMAAVVAQIRGVAGGGFAGAAKSGRASVVRAVAGSRASTRSAMSVGSVSAAPMGALRTEMTSEEFRAAFNLDGDQAEEDGEEDGSSYSSYRASRARRRQRRIRRMNGGRRVRRGRFGVVPGFGRLGTVTAFVGRTLGIGAMAGAVGGAIAIGAGVAMLGVHAMRGLDSAGASAMRRNAMYSPQVAGLQAQVDVAKVMSAIAVANNPSVVNASRLAAVGRIAVMQALIPVNAKWDAALIKAATGGDIILGALKAYAVGGPVDFYKFLYQVARGIITGVTRSPQTTNGMFHDMLDEMTGGLLAMQEARMPAGRLGQSHVRYGKRGWERFHGG